MPMVRHVSLQLMQMTPRLPGIFVYGVRFVLTYMIYIDITSRYSVCRLHLTTWNTLKLQLNYKYVHTYMYGGSRGSKITAGTQIFANFPYKIHRRSLIG